MAAAAAPSKPTCRVIQLMADEEHWCIGLPSERRDHYIL